MAIIDKHLLPGEKVEFRAGVAPAAAYAPAVGMFVFALIIFALIALIAAGNGAIEALVVGLVVGLLVAVPLALAGMVRLQTTELAVTDRRVITSSGWLRRKTSEIGWDRVEGVDVDEPLIGRILGFGTVSVRGVGQGVTSVPGIESPFDVRRHLLTFLERHRP